ncbi:magnesium transporter [Micromonospora sp. NPDC000442]|uniref:magnesium transporter n=1 Tax=Micromonospora sp. NPDC000442 TaxID=3364217 RepID=UPI0036A4FDD6
MTATLQQLVERNDLGLIRRWLDDHPPHEIADALARLDGVAAGVPFRLLDKDRALAVFEELEPVDQRSILMGLRDLTFHDLVEGMDPDDRARMLTEAPAKVARVGLLLGTMLALVGLVVGAVVVGGQIALIVGISLIVICAWAATVGATMPLLAKRLRIDPAVVSAPMVTTLVDATGLIIYFAVAHTVLSL